MVSTQIHSAPTPAPRKRAARAPFSRQKAYGWGAAFCFSAAFTLPPLGLLFLIIGWLSGTHWLTTFGSILLISVLLFLGAGATCLDCREDCERRERAKIEEKQ